MGNIPACCNNGSQLQNITEDKVLLLPQFDSAQVKAVSLEVAKTIKKIQENTSLTQKKIIEFPKIDKNMEELVKRIKVENQAFSTQQQIPDVRRKEIIGFRLGSNMAIYEGIVHEGIPNGKGKLILSDFSYFEGIFSLGSPTFGLYIFPGSVVYYKGQINNFQASGKGILQNMQTNYLYEGQWNKNLPHGYGIQKYQNGELYSGRFLYGSKFNDGIYFFKDGSIYEGQFYNNYIDGQGRMILISGDSYEGEWKLGKMHGNGTYLWQNGEKYEGQYKNGERDGKGIYFFRDGKKLDGKWEQGQQKKGEDEPKDDAFQRVDLSKEKKYC